MDQAPDLNDALARRAAFCKFDRLALIVAALLIVPLPFVAYHYLPRGHR